MKYLKPKSVTWWASAVPLALGIFAAMEPIHGLADWVAVISAATGGLPAYVLINTGLIGIGLRGAMT